MLKKITTTITANHKALARKTVVLTGVTLGIVIGLLLNKVEDDPDVVVIEELREIPDEKDQDKEWEDADPNRNDTDNSSE